MKIIKAKIVGDYPNQSIVWAANYAPDDEITLQLNYPNPKKAYEVWNFLMKKGFVNCRLIGESGELGFSWHLGESDEEKLEIEIATYDYYYQMSDDARVYNAGRYKDGKIDELKTIVGEERYKVIWNRYLEEHRSDFGDGFVEGHQK